MPSRRLALLAPPLFVALALAAACGGTGSPPPTYATPAPKPVPPDAPAPPVSVPGDAEGIDEQALDKSVPPCDDFYRHACGSWLKNTPIPDEEATWGRSFDVIEQKNELTLRAILERDAEGKGGADPHAKELGDFYASCTDEAAIEKAGVSPLTPELARIDAIKDVTQLTKALARLHAMGVSAIFDFDAEIDVKDTNNVIAGVSQSGLGLPDRDYYLDPDPKKKELRAQYEAHMARMFELAGEAAETAKSNAATVMKIERSLAEASMTKVELRDPQKLYNRLDLTGLKKIAPTFGWDAYLAESGIPGAKGINVSQIAFMKKASAMAKTIPIREWRSYLRWHLLRRAAPTLSASFVDEDFAFRKLLTGAKTQTPRWKRCVRAVDGAMGEALAQPFVAAALGDEGKRSVLQMVHEIEAAMQKNLGQLAWMDGPTRVKAEEKLRAIKNKIGYPDKWRSYEGIGVARASYFDNVARGAAFEHRRSLAKIGKPVDRSEWEMTPPTVNAYYEPPLNEMVFPAGILQSPFFSVKAQIPRNFGAIGMVIGHELTHGFDDEGRQYDASGNLKVWWTKEVSAEFDKRASCVEKQFDGYVAVDDMHVNGKLTLGENIADIGGLELSYAAMASALASGRTAKSARGYTPQQEFFLGFAQAWCVNIRPEAMRLLVSTNPHAPPKFRVNGPLSNLPQFAEAFACKAGSPMVRAPEQRCKVW